MAHLYESMLREMRDAAGDSGEFYTPRPVIRFMVQQVDPRLGEMVLDPAVRHRRILGRDARTPRSRQVETTHQRQRLHQNLRGIEKKPLPYLLGLMNLVLHEVDQPNITRTNSLTCPITQTSAGPSGSTSCSPTRRSVARRRRASRTTSRPTSGRRRPPGCFSRS